MLNLQSLNSRKEATQCSQQGVSLILVLYLFQRGTKPHTCPHYKYYMLLIFLTSIDVKWQFNFKHVLGIKCKINKTSWLKGKFSQDKLEKILWNLAIMRILMLTSTDQSNTSSTTSLQLMQELLSENFSNVYYLSHTIWFVDGHISWPGCFIKFCVNNW